MSKIFPMKLNLLTSGNRLAAVLVIFLVFSVSIYAQVTVGTSVLAWSPDGMSLASANEAGFVYIWDSTGKLQQTLTGHDFGAIALDWSPDGRLLVTGGHDGYVRVWDVIDGLLVQTLNQKHEGDVLSVDWNPVTAQIASSSMNEVFIWDAMTWQHVKTLGIPFVNPVKWSPSGESLAVGGSLLYIFDSTTFESVKVLIEQEGFVSAIDWNSESNHIASGDEDRDILIWSITTGEAVVDLGNIGSSVQDVTFSPDNKLLAVATAHEGLQIWDAETVTITQTISSDYAMRSVDWNSQSNALAFGGVLQEENGIRSPETGDLMTDMGIGIIFMAPVPESDSDE